MIRVLEDGNKIHIENAIKVKNLVLLMLLRQTVILPRTICAIRHRDGYWNASIGFGSNIGSPDDP